MLRCHISHRLTLHVSHERRFHVKQSEVDDLSALERELKGRPHGVDEEQQFAKSFKAAKAKVDAKPLSTKRERRKQRKIAEATLEAKPHKRGVTFMILLLAATWAWVCILWREGVV